MTFEPGLSIFEQVVYAAKKAMIAGQLSPGDTFPSVRTLSKELKINPNTAHKIVTHLISEGLLETRPGIGTLVATPPNPTSNERTQLLVREVEALVLGAKRLGIGQPDLVSAIASQWDTLSRREDKPARINLSIPVLDYESTVAQRITVEEPSFPIPGQGVCPIQADGLSGSCLYPLRMPPPIDVSAQVSTQPCLQTATETRQRVETFIASDDNYLAYDFDPVATSPLRLDLPSRGPNSGLPPQGFLCPGSTVVLRPRFMSGRAILSFSQPDLILGPYVRHVASKIPLAGTAQ